MTMDTDSESDPDRDVPVPAASGRKKGDIPRSIRPHGKGKQSLLDG